MSTNNWSINRLQQAWRLATEMHDGQKYGGSQEGQRVEYLSHIGNVVFEILNALNQEADLDADLAIHCALLHDTVEDSDMTYEHLLEKYGKAIADGVLALTKSDGIEDKKEKMIDSLRRIKEQPKEVWMVKMADRISNLQSPPFYWTGEKIQEYKKEARLIYEELKEGSVYLSGRLLEKINDYA